ncbi:histidine kinase [Nocardioides gansuensis]|uniref:Histidine kinase n=1 Tax=Nocardioides gansuensis TaxID=2138300 RepID=A0A2T8FBF9_9ACTN|nr:DUF5931 domain-containing protein [Nocardioides gansuensis]PVG83036.1 histidine kinase [Nocardioides gansuensis]
MTPSPRTTTPAAASAAGVAVEDRLFRALAILRVVVTVNAVALNLYRRDNFDHPVAGALLVVAMTGWSGVAIWAYGAPRRRTPVLLGLDLALAIGSLLLTPVVKGADFNATVPGFWVMGALLAWAVHWHVRGGLVAAMAISVADLGIRDHIEQANYGNVFLLMIGGPIVGYMCGSLQRMATERDLAERAAAAAEERARLARAVHDGVLQVLSLMQRRGAEAGGAWAELGQVAGEQERSLRSLIRQQAGVTAEASDREQDLAGALEALGTASATRVEVSTPGHPVLLPGPVVSELVAAAGACLDNVGRHAGPDARAWVLLEELESSVVVTVRDDGPGIPAGRLEAAQHEGRLGVAESIRGRLAALGGEARLDTGSWGTEWELEAPR